MGRRVLAVPEGLEVVLLTVDESKAQIVGRVSTFVDDEGRFEFTGFATGPGLTYRVAANDGLFAPSVDLADTADWSNVELVIYDRTRSLDDLRVSSYSLLVPSIDARSRTMGVLGAIDIRNEGDTVWLPDLNDPGLTGLQLVRFSIPGRLLKPVGGERPARRERDGDRDGVRSVDSHSSR